MSADYALLFGRSRKPMDEVWEPVLAATRSFGSKYTGIATRLSWDEEQRSWRFSMETRQAPTSDHVLHLFSEWKGLALALETRFGPMSMLMWDAGQNKTAFGIYQNSYAVTLQREDADVMAIFEQVALEIIDVLGSDLAVLVGDPSVRAWCVADLKASLAEAPTPTMEPLLYWAVLRSASDQDNVTPVAPQWLQRLTDHHQVYVHPAFLQEAD